MNVGEMFCLHKFDVTVSTSSFNVTDWINLCRKVTTTCSALYNIPGSRNKKQRVINIINGLLFV